MLGEAAGGGDEPTFVVNHGVSPEIRQKLRFGIRTRVTENKIVTFNTFTTVLYFIELL